MQVCSATMAAVEDLLRACLGHDPAAVSVLYFVGSYTGDYTEGSTGDSTGGSTGDYKGEYTGEYTGDYKGDSTGDFARSDQEP